jgi:hypothetical protein
MGHVLSTFVLVTQPVDWERFDPREFHERGMPKLGAYGVYGETCITDGTRASYCELGLLDGVDRRHRCGTEVLGATTQKCVWISVLWIGRNALVKRLNVNLRRRWAQAQLASEAAQGLAQLGGIGRAFATAAHP